MKSAETTPRKYIVVRNYQVRLELVIPPDELPIKYLYDHFGDLIKPEDQVYYEVNWERVKKRYGKKDPE